MEGFRNFTRAMDKASDVCSKWKNAEDGTVYSYAELMLLAAHLDKNYPLEERQWYTVFPDGEICLLHEDFEEIMPLWLPIKSNPILKKYTGDEFYPGYDPGEKPAGTFKYCTFCGEKLPADAVYCSKCGKMVK
ncbi:MAG: zinc ribbon domain-containing protein [Erysipelotrichales bacterium]|nr:zinc ribbon domain-containing protein [Erysipelotrichales bacterium]